MSAHNPDPESFVADVLQWDVRAWSFALQFWDQHVPAGKSLYGLDLGARDGGLSLWLAAKGHRVLCTDLEKPGEAAIALHRRQGVNDQILYEALDATHIPYEQTFDIVMFKSILGGIGRHGNKSLQQQTIGQVYKALKPGGRLFFAENLVASPLHKLARRLFVPWGSNWRYPTRTEMTGFLQPFSDFSFRTSGFLSAFGRSETQRSILAAADQVLINRIVPGNWHYVMAGVAIK